MHEDALSLPTKTTAADVGVCTDGAAAMTGRLSGLTTRIKEVAPECESTHCVIHREMLASRKIPAELNSVLNDVVKVINHINTTLTTTRP